MQGGANTGILIGYMSRGAIVACYTTGKVQGGDQTGGLVGYNGFDGGDHQHRIFHRIRQTADSMWAAWWALTPEPR